MDVGAIKQMAAGWLKKLGAYKYVLLVIAIGALLLLWPDGSGEQKTETTETGQESFSVEVLERKLEDVLSKIEGAGHVSVALTVKMSSERILAQDSRTRDDEESSETVVISVGSGKQEVVVQTERSPVFQGALVVCEGGDDPQVKLLVTQAVSALTGLGSARITVCKGK